MFIIIEGIDGSGKGTQFRKLVERLRSEGKSVFTLDFPRYDQVSSYFVRQYLNGQYGDDVDARTASLFYALDRFDALHGHDAELAKYDYVLSNRYVTSSMMHQGGKISDPIERRKFLAWLRELEYEILGLPRPDRVLFLDVPPSIVVSLISAKEARTYITSNDNIDLHEKDFNHLHNAYQCGHELIHMDDTWQAIPCVGDSGEIESVATIAQRVYSAVVQ